MDVEKTLQATEVVPDTTAEIVNLPKLSQNRIKEYILFAEKDDQKVLLPLKKVDIKSELHGATAVSTIELTYINPLSDNPLECTYVFPLVKTTLLAKFEAIIDDKVIETKVIRKEKAQEKYEDAVASGNAAVLAERKKNQETMTVKLGNLLPGQEATLKLHIVSQLEIVGGFYQLALPLAFYPDYRKHGIRQADRFVYEFKYEVKITAETRISGLSLPENAEIIDTNEENTLIKILCQQTSRTIDLYYRTADMMIPQLLYAESADGSGEIACSASFVPTFDPVAPQDIFNVVKDEKPESIKLGEGSDYHFIFLVDRSGSMGLQNRMQIAIDSLNLFMRSLPEGCSFSIISFGSQSKFTHGGDSPVQVYNNETKDQAIAAISTFSDDFGGTDILSPLMLAQPGGSYESDKKKRIFLLTDGDVGNADQVIQQARLHSDSSRVFTFGLGSGCDKNLVINTAKAGRGTHTIVKDGGEDLNGQVIRALSNAMEPSFKGVCYGWNDENIVTNQEIYRNSLIYTTKLLATTAQFDEVVFKFKTAEDQETSQKIELNFTKADFKKLEGPAAQALFKMAAFNRLQEDGIIDEDKINMSLKYQVLCDNTAILGIMKQENKTTGEIQETNIEFGKSQVSDDSDQNMYRGRGGARGMRGMKKKKSVARCAPAQKMMMARAASPQMMMMMMESVPAKKKMMAPEAESMMESVKMPEMMSRSKRAAPMKSSVMKMSKAMPASALQQEDDDDEDDDEEEEKEDLIVCSDTESFQVRQKESRGSNSIQPISAQQRSASPQQQPTTTSRPSFESVIKGQASSGFWNGASRNILASCIEGEQIEDQAVRQALEQVGLQVEALETAYLTLLALFILEECFAENADEWQLIMRKAKEYLEQVSGIQKPLSLARKFTLIPKIE